MKKYLRVAIAVTTVIYFLLFFTELSLAADSIPISTLQELQAIDTDATKLAASYVLVNDIDAGETKLWNNGKGFTPLGRLYLDSDIRFTGTFDGQGHVIKNLYINRPDEDMVGLFGHCFGGTLKNVGLENITVIGKSGVGALVGLCIYSNKLLNCYSTGTVSGISEVGGLVGATYYEDGRIENCYSTAAVSGTSTVGGLAGNIYEASISYSFSTGMVNGQDIIGGLVGFMGESAGIDSSYSSSAVTGTTNVGGLVGKSTEWFYSGIYDCFSRGTVHGENYVGGLIGCNLFTEIERSYSAGAVKGSGAYVGGFAGKTEEQSPYYTSCFWDKNASGKRTAGVGISSGVQAKTTPQMMTKKTFTSAGWDFETKWSIRKKSYPYLQGLTAP